MCSNVPRAVPAAIRRRVPVGAVVIPIPAVEMRSLEPAIERAVHGRRIEAPAVHALAEEPRRVPLLFAEVAREDVRVHLRLQVDVAHCPTAAQI